MNVPVVSSVPVGGGCREVNPPQLMGLLNGGIYVNLEIAPKNTRNRFID